MSDETNKSLVLLSRVEKIGNKVSEVFEDDDMILDVKVKRVIDLVNKYEFLINQARKDGVDSRDARQEWLWIKPMIDEILNEKFLW